MKPNLKLADDSPRSPGRQALAEAITQQETATTRLARLKRALAADSLYGDNGALRAFERAEAALKEAKAGESRHLAAVALGEAADDTNPVIVAQSVLAEAQSRLDDARKTKAALENQVAVVESEIKSAKDDLDKSIRAVLRDEASGVVETILQEAAALQEQLGAKRAVLSFLKSACFGAWAERDLTKPIDDFLATHPFSHRLDQHPVLEPWRRAVAALAANPDAPLPI